MSETPRLALPYLAPQQAQKHVTMNEVIRRLDAIVQASVETRALASPPGGPVEGGAYIPASGASGEWSGADGQIAIYQDGAWAVIPPQTGWRVWVVDEAALLAWSGAEWVQISGGEPAGTTILGVNAVADTINRLSVNTPSVLFNREAADINLTLNKAAAGDDARIALQTGFSSRALIGLLGGDDFTIKVSADGQSYQDGLFIEAGTGFVGVNTNTPAQRLHVDGGIVAGNNTGFHSTDASGAVSRILHAGADNNIYFNGLIAKELRFRTDNVTRMRLAADGGVIIGAAVGASKGAGTVNAQAVYDDNVLLSCYVFDQVVDGGIDARKWDEKVPDRVYPDVEGEGASIDEQGVAEGREPRVERRRHEPMRRFRRRIGTVHDPLTLDGYARHWKEKRHLTTMPNEAGFDGKSSLSVGDWAQRLLETVEIQAVLIEQLNQRMKRLETQRE